MTKPGDAAVPAGYDPAQFPAFAVTVDVVILTMSEGTLRMLLVRRGEAPFEGMWAIPGGFKRPTETLDEAARRELVEETGVDVPSLLTQFGAYGDPERDPRMSVVTIAYLAVLRDVGALAAGTDAAEAALIPVSDVLNGQIDLAFDHLRIVRDAVERVRVELEVTGIATAFVGTTFTLAELRTVYEAVWGVQLDAANFRRSVVTEDGWVIPTGRRARPGPDGLIHRAQLGQGERCSDERRGDARDLELNADTLDRIAHDPQVIECQYDLSVEHVGHRDQGGCCSIRARHDCPNVADQCEIRDRHDVHSRVALRIAVGTELAHQARGIDAGLLGQLPLRRLVQRFAGTLEATRDRPHPLERRLTTTHQQHVEHALGHGQDHHIHRHCERREPRRIVVQRRFSIFGFGHQDPYSSSRFSSYRQKLAPVTGRTRARLGSAHEV